MVAVHFNCINILAEIYKTIQIVWCKQFPVSYFIFKNSCKCLMLMVNALQRFLHRVLYESRRVQVGGVEERRSQVGQSPPAAHLNNVGSRDDQESYRGVADRFNVTKSTLAKHLHEFCSLVNVHMAHHISWPVGQTLHKSVLGFEAAGFPNTVCAVDGCHIRIQKPHCDNPLAYYNRKQFYSVILTGFCDSQRRFTHVCVGHPGSWHDARAFRLTEVARLLEEDPLSLAPQGMYMIGDSAYPLLLQLMRPFRDNGHLTARQRNFNRKLNSARVVTEHAFGILKTKFRRLQCLYMRNVKNISSAVSACCILYNICLDPGDQGDEVQDEEDDDPHPPHRDSLDAVHYRYIVCSNI
uniref:DDE Tnp4 domain-containing protein n=1 Tax=Astyanax mexicanus TaxID=7994 RepID=A0A3B1KAW0_ASTMX